MSDTDNNFILVQALSDNDSETAKAVLLWEAVNSGDLDRIEKLVEQGASPTHVVSGAGSTLEMLIAKVTKLRYLAWKMTQHERCGEVLNGTNEAWSPFGTAIALGDTGLAYSIMGHNDFDYSEIPWQFKFVIEESKNFSLHDEVILSANGIEELRAVVVSYFEGRANAGFTSPTFDEYVQQLANSEDE